jgi:hypothetical protein
LLKIPSKGQRDRSPDPEETPDIIPSRKLTAKEAEEDYQKQLALLAEQNKHREEKGKKGPRSNPSHDAEPRA